MFYDLPRCSHDKAVISWKRMMGSGDWEAKELEEVSLVVSVLSVSWHWSISRPILPSRYDLRSLSPTSPLRFLDLPAEYDKMCKPSSWLQKRITLVDFCACSVRMYELMAFAANLSHQSAENFASIEPVVFFMPTVASAGGPRSPPDTVFNVHKLSGATMLTLTTLITILGEL